MLGDLWQEYCDVFLESHFCNRVSARAVLMLLFCHVAGLLFNGLLGRCDVAVGMSSHSTLNLSRQGSWFVITEDC